MLNVLFEVSINVISVLFSLVRFFTLNFIILFLWLR